MMLVRGGADNDWVEMELAQAPEASGEGKTKAGRLALASASFLLIAGYFLLNLVVISPVGNFPLNDDWMYAHSIRTLLETGRYTQNCEVASCVLQIGVGALACKILGFSHTLLRIITLLLGFTGSLALYGCLRELSLPRRAASLMALVWAANPLFVNLSFSFMTDVPSLSLANVYFLLLIKGVRRDSGALLILSGIALAATLAVRQSFIVLFACNLLVLAARAIRGKHSWAVTVALFVLPILLVALSEQVLKPGLAYPTSYLWTKGQFIKLFNDSLHCPSKLIFSAAVALGQLSFYLGLFAAPVLVAFIPALRELVRLRTRIAGIWFLLSGSVLCTTLTKLVASDHRLMPVNQNLMRVPMIGPLTIMGVNVKNLKDKYRIWLTNISAALGFLMLSVLGGGAQRALGLIIRARHDRPAAGSEKLSFLCRRATMAAVCFAALACTLAYLVAQVLVRDLDRYYLIASAPTLMCLALCWRWLRVKPIWAVSVPLALLLALYSTLSTQDYLAWNRARWKALEALEAAGISYNRIDGGYEYDYDRDPTLSGFFVNAGNDLGIVHRGQPPRDNWRWWSINGEDYIVSFSPVPDYDIVGHEPYWSGLTLSSRNVLVLRRHGLAR